jgi:hypothetical protein
MGKGEKSPGLPGNGSFWFRIDSGWFIIGENQYLEQGVTRQFLITGRAWDSGILPGEAFSGVIAHRTNEPNPV